MGKYLIQVFEGGRWKTVARHDRLAKEKTALDYQQAKNSFNKVRIKKDGRIVLNWRYKKARY